MKDGGREEVEMKERRWEKCITGGDSGGRNGGKRTEERHTD